MRLGHDVFTRGELEPTAIAAACEALRRFRASMESLQVDRYRAVATSAVREAANGDVFVERAEREAGVHVEVIEGVEEARLVQLAVSERVSVGSRTALLVDIGGGSTELTLLKGQRAIWSRSLPVGTVRLLEAFLEAGRPIDAMHREVLDEYIDRVAAHALDEVREVADGPIDMVVGTGGNIETLADLCPVPSAFPEGRAIDVPSAEALFESLCTKSLEERVAAYGLRPDRADTIGPAIAVLCRVARSVGLDAVRAPGVGLKEGVLVDIARAHFLPKDFGNELSALEDACMRLGRRYHFDEQHGVIVARLAVRLFDDLAARHRLGPRDRILLHASALLHDVGDFIRYEGHHKHSYYLVRHSDLMGLNPEERELVANVARYHRKSPPHPDHDNFKSLSRESRAKVKPLAAILRVADALDREHRSKVADVRARIEGATLVLEVVGAHERALEEWTVIAKSGMMRDAFGLEVKLEKSSERPAEVAVPEPARSSPGTRLPPRDAP